MPAAGWITVNNKWDQRKLCSSVIGLQPAELVVCFSHAQMQIMLITITRAYSSA